MRSTNSCEAFNSTLKLECCALRIKNFCVRWYFVKFTIKQIHINKTKIYYYTHLNNRRIQKHSLKLLEPYSKKIKLTKSNS